MGRMGVKGLLLDARGLGGGEVVLVRVPKKQEGTLAGERWGHISTRFQQKHRQHELDGPCDFNLGNSFFSSLDQVGSGFPR